MCRCFKKKKNQRTDGLHVCFENKRREGISCLFENRREMSVLCFQTLVGTVRPDLFGVATVFLFFIITLNKLH